ncbi:MAG: CrcB family protein [Actinomycetota bacterium]|nr:CrcB family protein [Actinomycetota bacterium]
MATALWVALGGAVGSLARYALAGSINMRVQPWGTVTVNVLGSLVLGVLIGLWGFHADTSMRVGIAIGLLGGFTTFSSFTIDTIWLWEQGQAGVAVSSVAISVVIGLGAAILGIVVGRALA